MYLYVLVLLLHDPPFLFLYFQSCQKLGGWVQQVKPGPGCLLVVPLQVLLLQVDQQLALGPLEPGQH